MNTIYQLPTWAETVLIICIALMLTSIGVWLMCKAVTEAVNAASRLETKRTCKETEALDCWKQAYEAEHEDHINDVADLTNEILTLKREIEVKNMVLAKVKVADL